MAASSHALDQACAGLRPVRKYPPICATHERGPAAVAAMHNEMICSLLL